MTTVLPLSSLSFTVLPSCEGRVKSGATSPVLRSGMGAVLAPWRGPVQPRGAVRLLSPPGSRNRATAWIARGASIVRGCHTRIVRRGFTGMHPLVSILAGGTNDGLTSSLRLRDRGGGRIEPGRRARPRRGERAAGGGCDDRLLARGECDGGAGRAERATARGRSGAA